MPKVIEDKTDTYGNEKDSLLSGKEEMRWWRTLNEHVGLQDGVYQDAPGESPWLCSLPTALFICGRVKLPLFADHTPITDHTNPTILLVGKLIYMPS